MKKKYKIGVIGAGLMSTAIVNGVIASKTLSPKEIIVSDVNLEALNRMSKSGVAVTGENDFLADNSEFVLFAVKPQNISTVLDAIKSSTCKKYISIMAGVKKSKIKEVLKGVSVARCMPNTPCSIACGAIGADLCDYTDKKDSEFIKSLLSPLAEVVELPEEKLNAVTGVSGSSPAYFYLFLKHIIDSGVSHGLTESEAKILAANTMIGSGKMVLENADKTIDELINAVCSKGGTTIEAVKVFYEDGLKEIIFKAVDACVKRSFELENL